MDWSDGAIFSDNGRARIDWAAHVRKEVFMISTISRMAIHDVLLITFAVTVITLSILPEGEARQTLLIRDPSGKVQEYSLQADDPRLATLQRQIAKWPRRVRSPQLAMKKWYAEAAEHYATWTEPQPATREPFVAASFAIDDSTVQYAGEARQLSEQHDYWVGVAAEAREAITKAEMEIQRRQYHAGPPPIALGHVDGGGHPPRALILAGVFGICVASGFARWTYVCPSIRLQPLQKAPPQRAESDAHDANDELRLAIPPQWVRVHQPTPVLVRQTAYCALLITGIACAIL
jgi:hypothetical protein